MYSIYIVQNGDTLDSISSKTGVSKKDISNLNNLDPFYTAQVGDKLVIPVSSNTVFDRYEVKNGDNLYRISQAYNVDVNTLAKINGLKEDEYIYPGNVLLVPKKGVNIYVTSDGDNLGYISQKLNVPVNKLVSQNPNMILSSDQVIIYY